MVDFENDIRQCINVLENGGTILYPTDTVWGIGCDALNEAAVDKVFAVKQRPREKSLIVLLPDARDIFQYVAAPPPDIIGIIESFDRPTTVIFDGALCFPDNAIHESGSVAIRVPDDPFCKALLKRFKKPIISTSANLSGQPTPDIFSEIAQEVRKGVDFVVRWRQDDKRRSAPSRIVKLDEDGRITIIRP